MQLMPFLLILVVFWFLIIRPQSKKQKEHEAWLAQLKAGDDVVTQGGILGRVTGFKDDHVVIEVQQGVRLRVLRSAVTGAQKKAPRGDEAKAEVKAS